MKALVINGVVLGAFNSILELGDRYVCDNVEMQFSVVGKGEIVDADAVDIPVAPAQIPKVEVISMRQARLQLLSMNLLEVVNSAIISMPQSAQIEWEYSTEVKRDNALVLGVQSTLGMSDSDMDLFFVNANNL